MKIRKKFHLKVDESVKSEVEFKTEYLNLTFSNLFRQITGHTGVCSNKCIASI